MMGKPAPFYLALLFCLLPVSSSLFPQSRFQDGSAAFYYERGREYMAAEDWYSAAEALLECIKLSPAHAEAVTSLAECYYELGEYDEALIRIRKARTLARGNMALANLEAVTLIA
ncbi:MAG: tetratricopeptide repeat protein, partial [Treponema sp.]|nr:tetratricopeptide repeat protein [Treponema sp.]